MKVLKGEKYVEIEGDGKKINVFKDAELRVKRGEDVLSVYADEIKVNDDIIFDNKDSLWTLQEIKNV